MMCTIYFVHISIKKKFHVIIFSYDYYLISMHTIIGYYTKKRSKYDLFFSI